MSLKASPSKRFLPRSLRLEERLRPFQIHQLVLLLDRWIEVGVFFKIQYKTAYHIFDFNPVPLLPSII